jgi:hypothetical protein
MRGRSEPVGEWSARAAVQIAAAANSRLSERMCRPMRLPDYREWGRGMPGKQEDYRRTEREYRQHAEELFKIAEQTSEQEERERLLRMAEAWLGLAAKMKELSGGRS